MNRIFIVLLFILSGCSSFLAHTGQDSQLGKPYAGFDYAKRNAENCDTMYMVGFPPSLLVTLPISFLDIATSAVSDTILLPFDIAIDDPQTNKRALCEFNWK